MKKILSFVFILVLMMNLCTTAFAAESVTADKGTATIDISATYKAGTTAEDVISVDISWGAMSFEYSEGAQGRWNPDTHQYVGSAGSSWSASGNEITITNHSNVGIRAAFSYTAAVQTVSGTFSGNALTLATAVGTARDAAPSGSVALTLGGSLTAETAGKVGTVTISIEKTAA